MECKWADDRPHRALTRFAQTFPEAEAVQIVHDLRQEQDFERVRVRRAGPWLARLSA